MEKFLLAIKSKAKKNPKRIVFPEGSEPRVIKAAKIIKEEGTAKPILLGNPEDQAEFKKYANELAILRNLLPEEAVEKLKNPHMFGTMMVHMGDADGMIAGPTAPAGERILPALQIIKTKEKFHKVSGFLFMILPNTVNEDAANGGILMFADCAVNIEPNSHELADIAIDSAETAKKFGLEPKIAMLSFSTEGSTKHPLVKKVQEAADMVRERRPELAISNDMQVDAALMDEIGKRKAPDSPIAGHANILIFPDLEAGNIGYKLVERLAGAKAVGPILQGLKKPISEVSRGCTAKDIANLAAIITIEAQDLNYKS